MWSWPSWDGVAAPIFGLGVTDDAVYFGTYYDGAVLSVWLHRGEGVEQAREETEHPGEQQGEEREEPDVPVIEIRDLTTRELFSIAINDPDLQPIGKSAIFNVFSIIQYTNVKTLEHSLESLLGPPRTKNLCATVPVLQ